MNVYIWSDQWTTGENTLLYLPMKNNLLDKAGKYSVTNVNVTLTTLNGVKCGYFNGNARLNTTVPAFSNKNHTINLWYKDNGSGIDYPIISSNTSGYYNGECFRYHSSTELRYIAFKSGGSYVTQISSMTMTNWNNIVFSGGNIYVNGTLMGTTNPTYYTGYTFTVGGHATGGSGLQFITGYMGDVIIEDKVRTAEQVAGYYNQTKSLYGIS